MSSRGELEEVGSVIRRCLEAAKTDPFYRPNRLFQHKKQKAPPKETGQLNLKFSESVRDSDRPLIDLIPEAYQ